MKRLLLMAFVMLIGTSSWTQDSLNMKRMATLSGMGAEYTDIWGYRHGSKEFAVLGSKTSINIIDVTDCSNPVLVHQWVDGSNTAWRDFKDYGDYIYAVCDGGCGEGLQIINKNTFVHSQTSAVFANAHNIYVDKVKGKLYASGTNTLGSGLHIYDIATDPSNPILLNSLGLGGYVHDLYVQNDTAYCSHGGQGLKIWNLANPNVASFIGSQHTPDFGYNHSSWKHPSQPYVYVAEEVPIGRPIYIYDISDITSPFIHSSFKDPLEAPTYTNNRPHNPFVHLNRLYISYYHDGLQIYDVSDPINPEQIAWYDTYPENNGSDYVGYEGAWGTYPYLPSGCLLVSDITHGLSTLMTTLSPEARTKMPSNEIIIDNPAKGVVFITPDDQYIRITTNPAGKIAYETLTSPPTSSMEFRNSNLSFGTFTNGVIIKSINNDYFRIGLDLDNNIKTEQVLTLPPNAITLQNEDIYFSHYRGGVVIKKISGDCFHYTLGPLGVPEVTAVDCDN